MITPARCARLRSARTLSLLLCCCLCACGNLPRLPAPSSANGDAAPVGFTQEIRWFQESTRFDFERQYGRMQARFSRAADGQPLEILVLSGGGAGGSFGAGVLTGWTRLGTRPMFHVVTGVSTGALIAPLAFLGPSWDGQLTAAFSGADTGALLQSNWLGAVFGASAYAGEPLHRLVDRFVTDDLILAVAAEAAKGRILLVATTDLDREKLVIWDMGAIAAHGGKEARMLFRDVLIASASVPGVFPPVMIRVQSGAKVFDEMHVDGGTRSSMVAVPDGAAVSDADFAALRGANMYVLTNSKLGAVEETTPVNTVSILSRSVAAVLKKEARSNIQAVFAFSRRLDMKLRVSAIPNGFPHEKALDFDPSTMRILFDYGFQCATAQRVWGDALYFLDEAIRTSANPIEGYVSCPAPAGESGRDGDG
jgi:hypothetical protein